MKPDNENKPLWQKFYEMTPAQVRAEEEDEIRRMEAGEMSEAEARERSDAWRRACEKQLAEAAALERYHEQAKPRS